MNNTVNIDELTFEMTKRLRAYLKVLIEHEGSDLHVKSGGLIRGRINGELLPFSKKILSHDEGLTLAKELLRGRFGELVEEKSIDFTYKYDEHYRFRVNMFFQMDGVSGIFRVIPSNLPTIEGLYLPEVVRDFCNISRGLILVTGPTGSGKTSTLAAMINQINNTKKEHIITIEDPIEFEYEDKLCSINQRAVGQDALNFSSSLRAALREDPDVILVGEMRDLETVETALHAAETGHLVLSTLHTLDAKETVNRIIGMFPGQDHNRITMSLASVLRGTISQRLVKTLDGKRRAAVEVLVKTARIESLILDGNEDEITDAIEEGSNIYKSQTFDQSLLALYADGVISKDEALKHSSRSNDLQIKLDFHDDLKKKEQNKNEGQEYVDKDILALKQH